MKRFRVTAVDVNTQRAEVLHSFEARDEKDVVARLNAVGMVAENIDEVDAPLASSIPFAKPMPVPQSDRPIQRVVVDLSFSAQVNIAVAVFLAVIAAAVVLVILNVLFAGWFLSGTRGP